MAYTKPTAAEFTTDNPTYGQLEYAATLSETIDTAWLLYSPQILQLPVDVQKPAFKFAVCHVFQELCWVQMGYAGTPNELKSRNDSVVFKGRTMGLMGTNCGRQLTALLRLYLSQSYASEQHGGCHQPPCGC